MSKLTSSERKQIISDYKHGIPNEEYRVIDQGNGKYQVRKRASKFKMPARPKQEPEPKVEEEEEPKKPIMERMSNEELLRKLSSLLQVPQQEVEEAPEDYEHEEEAYEQSQQYINNYAQRGYSPYRRQPLKLC